MVMPTENEKSLEQTLKILNSDEQVSIPLLYSLSDLGPGELEQFCALWPRLNEERRRIVVRHLADITEENYLVDFSDVFAFCLEDGTAAVRMASLDGLWDTERVTLIDPILRMMQSDPHIKVRSLAAATLGHFILMAEWGQIPAESVEPAINALVETAEDEEIAPQIRRAALESLGAAPHPRVPELIEKAYDGADLDMQLSALFAMGRSADRRWLPIVLDEMSSPVDEMRLEAARASGGIGHSDAVPELAELALSDDLEVRLAAVTALGQIGSDRAGEVLQGLAEDPDAAEMHDAVDEALEELSWLGGGVDLSLYQWEADRDVDSFLEA
jgi:HEAT repeat protein